MATLDEIAAELAAQTMPIMAATGEDRLYYEVAKVLGASSQTLEEAYLTEIRVRLAGIKARDFLNLKEKEAGLSKDSVQAVPTEPEAVQVARSAPRIDPAIKAASIAAITGRPPAKPSEHE